MELKLVEDKNIEDVPNTKLCRMDAKGNGGAHHKYVVSSQDLKQVFAGIDFQNGPIKENGVNGCQNEDLLMVIIDRLECFQKGEFACEANHLTLTMCYETLKCMQKRTEDRKARGVEGESKA